MRTSSQCKLGVLGHRVALVQDNQLERACAAAVVVVVKANTALEQPCVPPHGQHSRACKILDLLAHNVDAAVVRSVELEDHLWATVAIHLVGERQDGGCLAGAWGTIQQQVRQAVGIQQALDWALGVWA